MFMHCCTLHPSSVPLSQLSSETGRGVAKTVAAAASDIYAGGQLLLHNAHTQHSRWKPPGARCLPRWTSERVVEEEEDEGANVML